MPASTPANQTSVDDYLELAGTALQEARLGDALTALHQAELLDPEDPLVHLGLGGAYLHDRRYAQAVTHLERAIALDPDIALAHYNLGMALQYLGRSGAAIAALRQAVALDATLADAHARLGDLLEQHHGPGPEATACFRAAAAAAPDTTLGRLSHAKVLIAEQRRDEAETCLRQAIALDPASGPTLWRLGSLLSEAGRFDAAIECFQQTIAQQPRHIGAHFSLVSAKRITEDDRGLIDRMTQCLQDHLLTDRERMALHFGLGKAFDDLRDYAAAIRHFDAANRIRRSPQGANRSVLAAEVDLLIGRCTPEFMAQNARPDENDETPVLIVGMPRSGTSLVEQILSSHPLVGAAGELGFWIMAGREWANAGMRTLDAEAAAKLTGGYLALLRSIAPTAARVTDKEPYNFDWLGLICTLFPRARIIHCRRNPIDTCLSIYCTPFGAHRGYESDRGDLVFYYRQYLRLMAHWRSVVPPERFLEIDYETVVAERETATRQLIAFCGLEWDTACLRHETNPSTVRTASMWQARQPIYRTSVERWRNYEPWVGELRDLL
jgi:tetratricopeptide (TPR) repeat protein